MHESYFLLLRLSVLSLALAATVSRASPLFVAKPQAAEPAAPQAAQPTDPRTQQAPKPQAQAPAAPAAQPLQLRIVNQATFCSRMRQAFSQYAASNGYDAVQQTLLATSATVGIVEEFKLGRAADYVSASALSTYSRVPHRGPQNGYLPLAGFVGNALGLGANVTLALSAGELRFIPYAQKNMEIVVIAQNAASLTPERAKKVSEVAKQAGIKINVVWVGGTQDDGQAIAEARSLAWLASVTGGAFANLSGSVNPCATPT
jgi:hypothetical protein